MLKYQAIDPTYIEHAKGELRDLGIEGPTHREAAIFVHCVEWWSGIAHREHLRGRRSGMLFGALTAALMASGMVLGWIWVR